MVAHIRVEWYDSDADHCATVLAGGLEIVYMHLPLASHHTNGRHRKNGACSGEPIHKRRGLVTHHGQSGDTLPQIDSTRAMARIAQSDAIRAWGSNTVSE